MTRHRCSNLSEKCMSTSGVYRERDHPVKDGVANGRDAWFCGQAASAAFVAVAEGFSPAAGAWR